MLMHLSLQRSSFLKLDSLVFKLFIQLTHLTNINVSLDLFDNFHLEVLLSVINNRSAIGWLIFAAYREPDLNEARGQTISILDPWLFL